MKNAVIAIFISLNNLSIFRFTVTKENYVQRKQLVGFSSNSTICTISERCCSFVGEMSSQLNSVNNILIFAFFSKGSQDQSYGDVPTPGTNLHVYEGLVLQNSDTCKPCSELCSRC